MLTVNTEFTATWSNYGFEPITRTFRAGERYVIQSTRPEGVCLEGFFLFGKHLVNCTITH